MNNQFVDSEYNNAIGYLLDMNKVPEHLGQSS